MYVPDHCFGDDPHGAIPSKTQCVIEVFGQEVFGRRTTFGRFRIANIGQTKLISRESIQVGFTGFWGNTGFFDTAIFMW